MGSQLLTVTLLKQLSRTHSSQCDQFVKVMQVDVNKHTEQTRHDLLNGSNVVLRKRSTCIRRHKNQLARRRQTAPVSAITIQKTSTVCYLSTKYSTN